MTTDELVICPGCRKLADEVLELRTLERTGDVLACACGRRYPVIDGVPIVLPDTARLEMIGALERDVSPEVAALLVGGEVGDDHPYARLQEHLSIYMDAHWGDRAEPPPDGATDAAPLIAKIAERSRHRVARAVELGCSAGRFVAELARGADHVVGLDLQAGAVRRARRLLAGETVAYNRRVAGRHYRPARVTAGDLAVPADRVTLLCADALDPPLVPGGFDRVVALNMIDSVARPRGLLAVADGLCAPGGELLLASPYSWQSHVMADAERLGGADPAATVRAMLASGELNGRYEVEDEADLAWVLRRDARSSVAYTVHYLRARKR